MKPVNSIVVLANDGHARLYSAAGVGKGLKELARFTPADFADVDPRNSERPGRGHSSHGDGRYAMEPRTSEERIRRNTFAEHVTDAIASAWEAEDFDRVILAAAPRMLGELRDKLPHHLMEKVSGEIDKDLINTPEADLPRHLDGHILV